MCRVTFRKRGTVNCGSCRWYDSGSLMLPGDNCERILHYHGDHKGTHPVREKRKASEINDNNNCPYWRWNWFGFRSY